MFQDIVKSLPTLPTSPFPKPEGYAVLLGELHLSRLYTKASSPSFLETRGEWRGVAPARLGAPSALENKQCTALLPPHEDRAMDTAAGHNISQVNRAARTVLKFSPPPPLILSTTSFPPLNFTISAIHQQAESSSVNHSQLKTLSFQMRVNSTPVLNSPRVYRRSGQHQAKQGRKRFNPTFLAKKTLPPPPSNPQRSPRKNLYFRGSDNRITLS